MMRNQLRSSCVSPNAPRGILRADLIATREVIVHEFTLTHTCTTPEVIRVLVQPRKWPRKSLLMMAGCVSL
jgi:hypothetical protein